jgi:hypothetical protein
VPFGLELRDVEVDCPLVVFETTEVDVGEGEETAVLEGGTADELMDESDEELVDEAGDEVVLLSVRVIVELIVGDDEAIVGPEEDVGDAIETEEGTEPDEGLETEDVGLGACRPTAEPSIRRVSTTATATTA